jgi:hypothetical protein
LLDSENVASPASPNARRRHFISSRLRRAGPADTA